MKVVYATTNPGKFTEVSKLFGEHKISIHSPQEIGKVIEVEESGKTLEENAILKAESYRDILSDDCIVLGDDTGVEIQALGGEPGIKVRRWKGYKMSDQEIIEYCLERMKDVPEGKRQAQFRTVIAVAMKGTVTKVFSGILEGEIVTNPAPQRHEGFPFESLFYATKWQRIIGDIYKLPAGERDNFRTHRHSAVLAALPYLHQLTRQS
jgi:XTP/dITP diphosphohydrolase